MNRRQFLKLSALIALSTACANNPIQDETGNGDGDKMTTVLVIGAGMAGVIAARQLHDAGYDVTVLEGRDRIGGRVWTSRLWADAPLDLGASWIHGIRRNPLTALADEIDAKRISTDYDNAVLYNTNGDEVDDGTWGELESLMESVIKAAGRAADADMTLREGIEATDMWHELSPSEQHAVMSMVNTSIEHEFSGSIDQLPARTYDDADAFGGDDILFPDGYGRLVEHLARDLSIELEQVVESIAYNDSGVTVTTKQRSFDADYVVITVPIGVLQQGMIAFDPPLPDDTQAAIDAMGFGLLNKLYLRFPNVFWDDEVEVISWIPDEYGRWAEWYNMAFLTKQPILLGFNAADYARQTESWTDEEIVADAMDVLRTWYGDDIPEPEGWQMTRWASDPFAYGSYSFNTVDADRDTRETLTEPVGNRLFFAGEATSLDFPSTVHGAYLSGVRAAEQILEG
ncbi:MAG: FAD-dependent oxidoreductase [Chloroflexota bacterium]